jgi:hypothetical protein
MDHPVWVIIALSAVTWGSISLAHAVARRSWLDCLVFGFLLAVLLIGAYGLCWLAGWPDIGVWLAGIVQGTFFLLFWATVAARLWRGDGSHQTSK